MINFGFEWDDINFNSRPCVRGDDKDLADSKKALTISIHAPA